MALEPIKKVNIAEQVFEQLKSQIIAGAWKVGDRIPSEIELCEMLGVSRSSVRQALRSLTDLGLIETKLGAGSFVKRQELGVYMNGLLPMAYLQENDILEMLDFSCFLEDDMAQAAAERATPEDVKALRAQQQQMENAKEDLKRFAELDLEFHLMIAKMTRNSLVIQTYSILNELLSVTMYEMFVSLGVEEGIPYHRELIEAIANHDGPRARDIMGRHVGNRREKYMHSIQNKDTASATR